MDDSNSLHRKRSFNQTSILKLLFRLPGIILVCQFFWGIYRENPRKWGERSAKASRKVQVPSSRVGPFQSQTLILVYFFQLYTASNLDDFKPKGFLFKPKHILKPLSPRKSCERWWCPDTIAKAKMMVAKVSRKVLRKGYMSISQWSLGFDHRSHDIYRFRGIWAIIRLGGRFRWDLFQWVAMYQTYRDPCGRERICCLLIYYKNQPFHSWIGRYTNVPNGSYRK